MLETKENYGYEQELPDYEEVDGNAPDSVESDELPDGEEVGENAPDSMESDEKATDSMDSVDINMSEAVLDVVKEHKEIAACVLFPSYSDFHEVCPCRECQTKLKELKDFEEEIKFKSEQVDKRIVLLTSSQDYCVRLSTCAWWTAKMLDFLHTNVREVCKKYGVSSTLTESNSATELKTIDSAINQLLLDKHVVHEEAGDDQEDEEKTVIRSIPDAGGIADEISYGLRYYKNTEFMDEAHPLLKKIVEVEKKHEEHKKAAESDNTPWGHSTSLEYIAQQIGLLKMIPVEKVRDRVESLVDTISPFKENMEMVARARNCIIATCRIMIQIRKKFWKQYLNNREVKGHDSSGLKETLELLSNQVNSFKDEWKKEYDHFVTLSEQSGPKRQRMV